MTERSESMIAVVAEVCASPTRQNYLSGCRCSACKAASAAYHREWRARDPERRRQYHQEWYRRDLDQNRSLRAKVTVRRRQETLALLGGKCVRCGFNDHRALQVDHVNGGGNQHRESIGHSASGFLNAIKKSPALFQLLCANYNWIKRHENKELKNGRRWSKDRLLIPLENNS